MVKMYKGGKFLKALDVKRGSMVTFLDEGAWEESTKFKNEDGSWQSQFIIKVKYDGEEKSLKLTKASRTAMMEAFGDESKDWVGKVARLIVVPTPNGDKKTILVDPVVEAHETQDGEAWDDEK